jgi:glutathione S-transferase
MRLYYHPVAPNPARVLFYATEKGLQQQGLVLEFVDLLKGAQNAPEFLRKNPHGALPVLELPDGTCLTESLAIIEYLEELHPDPPMMGTTALDRARTRAMERFIELNILLRVARAVHATRSPLGLPANPALAEYELSRLPKALARIDAQIADRDFVLGDRPSIADCTLLAAINFARVAELKIDPALENLNRWLHSYALRHS